MARKKKRVVTCSSCKVRFEAEFMTLGHGVKIKRLTECPVCGASDGGSP